MTERSPEDLAARGGWAPDFVTRSSNPPIYQTTAFDLEGLDQLDAVVNGQQAGYIYTRDGNPNHEAFAADVAALEGAEMGVACSSGMGAMTAAVLAHVRSGDHLLAARVLYGRTGQLLNALKSNFGVDVTFVDANDPQQFAAHRRENTRLAIVESVSNPLLEVADLPAIRSAIDTIPLLVDSTFTTPCLLRPIEHGATLVFHSASKYLNGHGDVMLGVIAGPKDRVRRIRATMALYGMNANPLECWLASRGLRTLPLRMQQVSQTAARLAEFLSRHPAVQKVFYPGRDDQPSQDVARRLLTSGMGGMLSFEIAGGRAGVNQLFHRLSKTIPFSPTLADARTTVSYPAGTSHKFMTAQERAEYGIGDGLVRLSVGLEDAPTLERELAAALSG